jgi:surface antigen
MVRKLAIIAAACVALTACAEGNKSSGRKIGTVAGAVVGVLVGSQIGSGITRTAAVVGLAVLGGWLGGELGEGLSTEDKQQAGTATQEALANNRAGQTSAWSNPNTGASGQVTPGPVYRPKSGAQAGKQCRQIDVVAKPASRDISRGKRTACRNAKGEWEVLSV